MGKHGRKHSGIHFENHHPGCMWGMLHILDYHHVRKMLPYKRRGGSKQTYTQNGDDVDTPTSGESQGSNSAIEDINSVSSPVSRGSVKSRIKARFAVEMSKRKGKHQRSSTSPAQLQNEQTISDHKPEPESVEQDSPAKGVLNVDSPKHAHQKTESSSSCFTFDPPNSSPEPTISMDKIDFCENSPDQTLLPETLDEGNNILLKQKLKYFKEQTKDFDSYPSKDFLEALDIVNLDRELLIKALQVNGSDLPDQFHGRNTLSPTTGFAKYGSFPLAGSSRRKVSVPSEAIEMVNGNPNSGQTTSEDSNKAYTSSLIFKSKNGVQVPIKRFKNLKQRLKHAINERKKEKHRITMDAIFHKIPYGKIKDVNRKFEAKWKGKAIDREGKDSPASSSDGDLLSHSFSKRKLMMRRTSSLTDSLHRYCELYDTTFNSGGKGNESLRSKLPTEEIGLAGGKERETFGRIFSLPDLKTYHYVQGDDSPDVLLSTCGGQKMLDSTDGSLESKSHLDALVESRVDENLVGKCVVNPDSVDQKGPSTGATCSIEASRHDVENEVPEKSSNYVNESSFHEEMASPSKVSLVENGPNSVSEQQPSVMDFLQRFESKTDAVKLELLNKSSEGDSYHFEVNGKAEAAPGTGEQGMCLRPQNIGPPNVWRRLCGKDSDDFNYVRNILEQSGFMENTLQETHAVDQPLDPSVYEEVNDTEGDYCNNHMLLFDLINEVLLEIYERSFSYCPIPFSPLAHIRPMPVGNRVLEEVWTSISWYLSSRPGLDHQSLDYLVSRDLSKGDGWMNLQFDTECAGLEIEDLIFDDLLDEVIYD